jgi:hypothetical protein
MYGDDATHNVTSSVIRGAESRFDPTFLTLSCFFFYYLSCFLGPPASRFILILESKDGVNRKFDRTISGPPDIPIPGAIFSLDRKHGHDNEKVTAVVIAQLNDCDRQNSDKKLAEVIVLLWMANLLRYVKHHFGKE